ncbi:hypothetical protein V6Z11_D11G019100 [Gossypium hirsutum]
MSLRIVSKEIGESYKNCSLSLTPWLKSLYLTRLLTMDLMKKIFGQWTQKLNSRTSIAQREEVIRRTVYVSDIDHQVTEEQLAGLFVSCGQVVDCRICGDPNSVLHFAFIEFIDEGAQAALNLAGTMLGFYPVKVLPSKTAIAPVNPTFLPRNEELSTVQTLTRWLLKLMLNSFSKQSVERFIA